MIVVSLYLTNSSGRERERVLKAWGQTLLVVPPRFTYDGC